MEMNYVKKLKEQLSELKKHLARAQEAEKKLQEERERYLSLVTNIPGAVYRCELSPTWKMYYISDAMFSHSLCPRCAQELYGNSEWYNKYKK